MQGLTTLGVGVKGEASENGNTVGVFKGLAGYLKNPHNSGGTKPVRRELHTNSLRQDVADAEMPLWKLTARDCD
jgi:hypothetical protein